MPKVTKKEVASIAEFLRGSYTSRGKKPVKRMGGNFWGTSRTRCTIIKPEMIEALQSAGIIEMGRGEFMVKVDKDR